MQTLCSLAVQYDFEPFVVETLLVDLLFSALEFIFACLLAFRRLALRRFIDPALDLLDLIYCALVLVFIFILLLIQFKNHLN